MQVQAFQVTPFMTNCFVLVNDNEGLVVDPGEATPELLEFIEPLSVQAIVNTHCHCDHCGGNAELVDRTGAELLCHEAELPLLQTVQQQGSFFGVPFPPSPEPSRFLNEGDELRVGSESLNVLLAPGHSPGHIVLAGEGFVVSGDVLFASSIGRTDLPGGNYEQLIHSIQTKLMPLPDDTVVHCGHGPSTTIGAERRGNPFLRGS